MAIQIIPSEIEGFEDAHTRVFVLKSFDEFAANIEIETLVSADSWPEISDAILRG